MIQRAMTIIHVVINGHINNRAGRQHSPSFLAIFLDIPALAAVFMRLAGAWIASQCREPL
jgi:hypothetical protein